MSNNLHDSGGSVDENDPLFSSPAQAVLKHITKVKLQTQEKIFALQHEVRVCVLFVIFVLRTLLCFVCA